MTRRVLVIGAGSIGERHIRCFGLTGRAKVSVCEPTAALRRRIQQTYSLEQSSADIEDFITDPPDAAVICTPAPLHIPIAAKFANASTNLLIEKPLSVSTDGVSELSRIVRREQITVAVAYVLRTHPVLAAMRDAIRSGRFGQPRQLVFTSGQNFPFFRPAYREIYYASRQQGGGAIQDALTHGVNAAEWLIGPVTEVAADADHQLLEGVEVEDTVHVIARHGDVMANYSLNQYQAANETTFTVACSDGVLRCHLHQARWFWQQSPTSDWIEAGHHAVERDELFVAQAHHFLDVIEHQRPPLCSLDEGLQTLRTMLAILDAADHRNWTTVRQHEVRDA